MINCVIIYIIYIKIIIKTQAQVSIDEIIERKRNQNIKSNYFKYIYYIHFFFYISIL